MPQCPLSDARLAQELPHNVGDDAGQPETHAYVLPDGPQLGVPPVHVVRQSPQWSLDERSTSQPSAALAEQWPNPFSHWNAHLPLVHAIEAVSTCASSVQSVPHEPQL
jgi:hypothetical protein